MTGGMLKGPLHLILASAGCGAQDGGYHVPYAHATLAEGLDMPSYRRQGSLCGPGSILPRILHCTSCPACVAAEGSVQPRHRRALGPCKAVDMVIRGMNRQCSFSSAGMYAGQIMKPRTTAGKAVTSFALKLRENVPAL